MGKPHISQPVPGGKTKEERKENMKSKTFRIVSIAASCVILAIVIALNVAVGVFSDLIDKNIIGYKDSASSSAARESGAELAEQIQGEGTVLVKNDGLLPLSVQDVPQVNVFGWAVSDWVISGSGSGQVKGGSATDFLTALTESGIGYNTEITSMYESFYSSREYSSHGGQPNDSVPSNSGSLHSFNYEFSRLYEPSISDTDYYTSSMLESALEYSDTAIVVIGRVSGESNDSPKIQYKRTKKGGSVTQDTDRTYLEISSEEEELLTYVGANYENTIVLINSTNVMELGFLDTIDGLDACMIVATTGSVGAKAIPKLLYGDLTDEDGEDASITPSGRTADTYAYDLSTSSTYADTGSGNDTTNFYTNGSGLYPTTVTHTNGSSTVAYDGVAYTDYRESVYMGYRWYETADEEGFWDSVYAQTLWDIPGGYEDVVQYPFGYGLSYTDFEWRITYLEHTNNTSLSKDGKIVVGVTVTNVGDMKGQDVVELYYSPPYTANGIEKSSVTLAAFGKTTQVLEPGESEYVELEFDVEDMKSYDYGCIRTDAGGYVLEKGTYTLTLRTDAHTVADSKVMSGGDSVHGSATITYEVASNIVYDTDSDTGNDVENRFTGEGTTDGVAIDGNSDESADITYLSRASFTSTFPEEQSEDRAMSDEIMELNLYTSEMADEWAESHPADPITTGDTSQGDIVGEYETQDGSEVYTLNSLGESLGLDYDDAMWEEVLNRISLSEMKNLVLHGYVQTAAVSSIGKPQTMDLDGPNQIGSFSGNITASATGFSAIVLAQTWNSELAYSMGLAVGTECASYGVNGWYGPATNLHRSPFGGRNYEYYSEDPLLSGVMCARTVEAAKNKGVYCYLKHLCLYETESGRDGMYTWLTEQALRELYIKPFEIAVKDGGATGIMTSYGRIGAVWTGGSEALLTEVVRGEWGFQGAFLTDYADHQEFMNGDQMVRAGGDLWMDGWLSDGSFQFETESDSFQNALRDATKHILYMWLNALATNSDYNAKIESGEIEDTITIQCH